jgi:hypothetical protein
VSIGTIAAPVLRPIRLPRSRAALISSIRIPLLAFVASRLIVGLSGVLGVSVLRLHDPVAAARARAVLGPAGSLLAASVDRFDAAFYLDIAAHGFGAPSAGRTAFFPLYPLLIRLGTPLTGSGILAGAVISAAAFLVALILLHRLTTLELDRRAADATVWLLALAPLAFFFTAIYSESVFLALGLGAALAARRDHWRLACALGAAATLTRPVGIALVVVLVGLRVHSRGDGWTGARRDRALAWVLLAPAALAAYLGSLALDGRGWLAPFAAQAGWGRTTTGPVISVAAGAWAAARGAVELVAGTPLYRPQLGGPLSGPAEAIVLFVALGIVIGALVVCRRRLPWPYPAFAAAALLLTLSSPAAGQPLWSQDRFALVLFPLWMASGSLLSERRGRRLAVLGLSAGLLVFYTAQFASWSFVA